jgi:hypothetical protein
VPIILRVLLGAFLLHEADKHLNNGDGERWITDQIDAQRRAAFAKQEVERKREAAVAGLTTKFGLPSTVSAQILDYIGIDRTQTILSGKLGLWCQHDRSGLRVNRVLARLENTLPDETFGQMHYLVSDIRTAKPEMRIDSYGFRLNPHGILDIETPLLSDLPTPGLKRITVIDRPKGVT